MPDGKRILVVDDDSAIRQIIVHFLKDAGYQAWGTGDARSALALASEIMPELAIFDVMMPEVDGFRLAEQFRATPSLAGVPFIFLTAQKALPNIDRVMQVKAAGYIEKPFAREPLLAMVKDVLAPPA